MFQGPDTQLIPEAGAYDIVNGLVDQSEGVIYRRGGGASKATNPASMVVQQLWDGQLSGGQRTVITGTGAANPAYALDATDAAYSSIGTVTGIDTTVRPTGHRGAVVWPVTNGFYAWAGSRKAVYSTGTVTVALGSATVSGAGTSWSANVDAGAFFIRGSFFGIVASVESNTSLTLTEPWGGTSAAGAAYNTQPTYGATYSPFGPSSGNMYVASVANRLVWMRGNILKFSDLTWKWLFTESDYHAVPGGAVITGAAPLRDDLVVFTTGGVYLLRNMALDLTDAAGNPQQAMSLISPEMKLWHNSGLATWQNTLIVPATDGVYLMDGASSPVQISEAISDRYQAHVAAGYTLGPATVFRGHYILPVWSATTPTWADTLVCDLATRSWTRMTGQSGECHGFAKRDSSPPLLLGTRSGLTLNATGWFAPVAGNKNEADGTTHTYTVTTRDYTLSSLKGFVKKLRLWVEGIDAASDNPTMTVYYATGPAGSSFTSLGSGNAESTADAPANVWTANVGAKRVRFKLESTSPFASLKLKALDLFVRPRSRV